MIEKLLVIAAHPDDEVLGCGGLISRTVRNGGDVVVLILTEGSSTQYPDRPDLITKKEEEARAALAALGGGSLEFGGLPDMALSTLAPAEVSGPVEKAVARHRPDWVAVHHHGDLNRDHQVAHEATRVACRPGSGSPRRLISYETLSSTEWGPGLWRPDLYVSLEAGDVARKVEAMECYETEVRSWPHPRSGPAIRHLAATRGAQAGFNAAEAFSTVWEWVP